jgi:hypothetical protein
MSMDASQRAESPKVAESQLKMSEVLSGSRFRL